MGIHDGHRERMRQRAAEHGLEGFSDLNALELLLYYVVPRSDTNPLAHRLLDRFGSFAAVLDAAPDVLQQVQGVGENVALFLHLIPQFSRRYEISRNDMDMILDSPEKAGAFLLPRFCGAVNEMVYILCLDARKKLLCCRKLSEGTLSSAAVSLRSIVHTALSANASSVILAHNHAGGFALPSRDDISSTRRIRDALESVDVSLADHLIVAENDFVSLRQSGLM